MPSIRKARLDRASGTAEVISSPHHGRSDGILYRARHDPERICAEVFDHVESELVATSVGTFLRDENRVLLGDILDTYGFGLLP
jgi:hypothetical protein